MTNDMFKKYSELTLQIARRMYSQDTTLKAIGIMSSEEAILKMEQILSTNPSEKELQNHLEQAFPLNKAQN